MTGSVVYLYSLLVCALVALTQGATTKTLCVVPINQDISMACHAAFATKYYQQNFSTITWQYKYLTPDEGTTGPTAKNFVKTWALQSQHCDLLIGPGYSFLATAMSPLVEVPWVDASATSTELSDKKGHPFFSRVIPTDEVGASAAGLIYEKFGWERTNIMCSDEPYGRSVAAGVSTAVKGIGGQVDETRCFQSSAPEEDVRAAIEVFLQSKSKVVFVAGLPFHDWFTNFKKVVKEMNASEKLIFFFSEAFCSAADRTYVELVGGLCATYTGKEAVMAPFLQAMQTVDRSDEFNALRTLGYGDASIARCKTGTDIYSVLAHDAAVHGMNALTNYERELQSGKTAATLGSKVEYLRKQVTDAATGRIILEKNGDRKVVDLILYNSLDANTENPIGFVVNQVFKFHNPSAPGSVPQMTLFGETKAEIPPIATPETPVPIITRTEGDNTGMIVAIIVSLVIAIALGIGIAVKMATTKQRDNSTAPKNHEEPFTVVFTDIQSSTALWAREPLIMSDAVEMHHSAIRELIKKHHGYEVKTIGDSFMCAFCEKKHAVEFSLDIQKKLFEMTWFEQEIDVSYMDLLEEAGIGLPKNYGELWNGIRVRVGIHHGIGSIQEDPVTLGFDYYGTVVNTAARVESVGHGGQVLATAEVLKDLKLRDDIQVHDLGCQQLRGLDDGVHLFELSDKTHTFSARTFPPLRLDKDFEDNETESQLQSDQRSQQSNMSQVSMNGMLHIKASKYAKNQGVVGHQATFLVEEILQYQQFAKVLFSTTKDDYRFKTLAHLASKWRIPGVNEKSLKAGPREYEAGVMDIVAKALQATRLKFAKENEVQMLADGGSSTCSKNTTELSRTRRNSGLGDTPLGNNLPGQPVS